MNRRRGASQSAIYAEASSLLCFQDRKVLRATRDPLVSQDPLALVEYLEHQVLLANLDHLDHRDEQDLFLNPDYRDHEVLEARLDLQELEVNAPHVIDHFVLLKSTFFLCCNVYCYLSVFLS